MRALCLATALLVAATTGQAQALRSTTRPLVPAVVPPDPARVQDALARADLAWQEGRGRDSRRIYQKLIADQAAAQQFAGTAMWRLALNYLYSDDKARAAAQLDLLADEAARFGDPAMQLRATFEAAVLWQQLRRPDLVVQRVERAKALLQSPAIPDADKEAIRRRMA